MLPMLRASEGRPTVSQCTLGVQLIRANDGTIVAQLIGHPAHVPGNWLSMEAEIQQDVAYVLEKADRYSRLEGQPAILVYDADNLWQNDWGVLA